MNKENIQNLHPFCIIVIINILDNNHGDGIINLDPLCRNTLIHKTPHGAPPWFGELSWSGHPHYPLSSRLEWRRFTCWLASQRYPTTYQILTCLFVRYDQGYGLCSRRFWDRCLHEPPTAGLSSDGDGFNGPDRSILMVSNISLARMIDLRWEEKGSYSCLSKTFYCWSLSDKPGQNTLACGSGSLWIAVPILDNFHELTKCAANFCWNALGQTKFIRAGVSHFTFTISHQLKPGKPASSSSTTREVWRCALVRHLTKGSHQTGPTLSTGYDNILATKWHYTDSNDDFGSGCFHDHPQTFPTLLRLKSDHCNSIMTQTTCHRMISIHHQEGTVRQKEHGSPVSIGAHENVCWWSYHPDNILEGGFFTVPNKLHRNFPYLSSLSYHPGQSSLYMIHSYWTRASADWLMVARFMEPSNSILSPRAFLLIWKELLQSMKWMGLTAHAVSGKTGFRGDILWVS